MKRAVVKQALIARAIRAVEQTGGKMAVEIAADGTIRIVPHNCAQISGIIPIDKPKEYIL